MSVIDNVFGMEIERVGNGYIVHTFEGDAEDGTSDTTVISDDENDDLRSTEELLWEVIEYFGKLGSRHDAERLHIRREPGDKWEQPKKEKK